MGDPFKTLKSLGQGKSYYSLPALEEQGIGKISRLPVSIRIMLESLLRNHDGMKVKDDDIKALAQWNPQKPSDGDVPFVVARVLLQDFTGVPLLVDLAAMRDAVAEQGFKAGLIEPRVPVDLVVDHSVQVDRSGTADAFMFNLKVEFDRNRERYEFLKWGQGAFETFKVVPPGIGICHQVNLENIASVVMSEKQLLYPDTLVGTDSHTTMINGLGVVGWGVGGIEAEAAMLGQPVSIQTPEVIGVHLLGSLKEGVTATDLTLRITELLRKEKVVGKFVEFFGEGTASLSVADRATIGNMSPEYGATMGFFPCDEKTLDYLRMTGRDDNHVAEVKAYLEAQKLFGIPKKGQIDYTKVVELDLKTVSSCVAGPKRPQDRINLDTLKEKFHSLMTLPIPEGGYGKDKAEHARRVFIHAGGVYSLPHDTGGTHKMGNGQKPQGWSEEEMVTNRPFNEPVGSPGYDEASKAEMVMSHGSVVIAAITSCTNTSNPSVMIGAGLLAKKAVEKGLSVNPLVKTSLAPGSRVVTDYLDKSGLQTYLNQLGFQLVAYGCTTCIGNSGPLEERIEKAIQEYDIVAASVLSGNRNFEARIHGAVKANFLMSPPLVVAFALAGRIDIDMEKEPIGHDKKGKAVFLRDIWPTSQEIQDEIKKFLQPSMFKQRYAHIMQDNPVWEEIQMKKTDRYGWDQKSTYIQKPPYFEKFGLKLPPQKELKKMRALALFGDSVTTDHISPAGAFSEKTPAGKYLLSLGVKPQDFNSYGSRRGNHQVMMRGTFANVRILNKMAGGKEGGYTKMMPEGELLPIYDGAMKYTEKNVPLIIFAGKDYGMGSSRDWAAKGTALLGVRVVVARSFERIHRSNLIGMGVLPLEFKNEESFESLGIQGDEVFSIEGEIKLHQDVVLEMEKEGKKKQIKLKVRIDTPIEVEYYRHGGIMPYVLRQLLKS
ncbi:MAG TPA: aconitate hydratase [Rhabdochlamydiaceae bacterium]|jgi:aconitate hydratase|nr:aconitate hydratase [Rhabdochlamydiaceae bacterium]